MILSQARQGFDNLLAFCNFELATFFLLILVFQNVCKSLLMKVSLSGYTGDEHPPERFLYSSAVICGEALKGVLSIAMVLFGGDTIDQVIQYFRWMTFLDSLKMAVPALCYYIQQNLEFLALYHLSAPVFQVVVQLKLLSAAIFSVALLGRRLQSVQWISLVILTVGVILAELDSGCSLGRDRTANQEDVAPVDDTSQSKREANRVVGITAVIVLVGLSGFAGVYTEMVLKKNKSQSIGYTNIQMAAYGVLFGAIHSTTSDMDSLKSGGFFQGFTFLTWTVILISAAGGLLVAATLRYSSNIAKGYAIAVAVLLVGVLSQMFFNAHLGVLFWLGCIIVVCSVYLYNSSQQSTVATLSVTQSGSISETVPLYSQDEEFGFVPKIK